MRINLLQYQMLIGGSAAGNFPKAYVDEAESQIKAMSIALGQRDKRNLKAYPNQK